MESRSHGVIVINNNETPHSPNTAALRLTSTSPAVGGLMDFILVILATHLSLDCADKTAREDRSSDKSGFSLGAWEDR